MIETCGRCHWGIQTSIRIFINECSSVTDLVFSFLLKTTEPMCYVHSYVYMCMCYTQCIRTRMYRYAYVYKYTWFKYISVFLYLSPKDQKILFAFFSKYNLMAIKKLLSNYLNK